MKFTFGIKKHHSASAGRAEGHNHRLHDTASQLPRDAWFGTQPVEAHTQWRADQLAKARSLAKRKDAVVAVEFVVQIGSQADWRAEPTKADPYGRPKRFAQPDRKRLTDAVHSALAAEFGEENIVSLGLHLDESTPHWHVIVTPIRDGKLQAKQWLDGAATCAALRKRVWERINRAWPCDYTPGAHGGAPHDPRRAAGGSRARRAPPPPAPLTERAKEFFTGRRRAAKAEARAAAAAAKLQEVKQAAFAVHKSNVKLSAKLREKKPNVDELSAKMEVDRRVESAVVAQKQLFEAEKYRLTTAAAAELAAAREEAERLKAAVDDLKNQNRDLKNELSAAATRKATPKPD